jgi:periplasmic divalent cation tolerance protein
MMSEGAAVGVMAVLSTAPDVATASQIGAALVEERLAACVNVVEGVSSIYRWKGAVQRDREVLMVLKTTTEAVERLRSRLVELHPYEVPEALALPVSSGHPPYLEWVRAEVAGDV